MEDSDNLDNAGWTPESTPIIPPNPILSISEFTGGKSALFNLLDVGTVRSPTSGRMAIALALELEKIGKEDEILIPAYHCSSMVAPVVHYGAKPVFYKILPDMSVDLEDIEEKLTPHTKGLLITHYFGFVQPIQKIRDFCDRKNIILIEDCAHAFFGEVEGKPIGSFGDYAVGSYMKFFPVFDGGCLVSGRHSLKEITLESGGVSFELQSLINILELSFKYNRLRILSLILKLPLKFKSYLWSIFKTHNTKKGRQPPIAPNASHGGFDFDKSWIRKKISRCSNSILRICSTKHLIEARLQNYRYLSQQFSDSDKYKPLLPVLPDHTVPYVFPLLITDTRINVNDVFYNLRKKGIPLLRWEELWDGVDSRTCDISQNYSQNLIQIPCHQSLSQIELDRMITLVKDRFKKIY
ncbi:MAG: aminotransferase class V-fold PLP-dependent enzyme [Sedimenticola sp.]